MSEDNLVQATADRGDSQCDQLHAKPYPFSAEQEAWLRDLETTTEPQTRGALHRLGDWGDHTAGYCCLGRGCVALGIEEELDRYSGRFLGEKTTLPEAVVKTLRLRGDCGNLFIPVEWMLGESASTLTELNDEARWPFAEIAAYIRANPWNVFLVPEEQQ